MSSFSIKKWNPMGEPAHWRRRGVLVEGDAGSYWVGVKFTCQEKGFVVQKISKKIVCKRNNRASLNTTKEREYWEIFYIGRTNSSRNADLFMQKGLGSRSRGEIIQSGHASFYPYNGNVTFDREGTMKLTNTLQGIFGDHITVKNVEKAAGLPAGYSPPAMTDLKEGPVRIIHQVEMVWGLPSHTHNQNGYEGTLTETVWRGPEAHILDMERPDGFGNYKKEVALIS